MLSYQKGCVVSLEESKREITKEEEGITLT